MRARMFRDDLEDVVDEIENSKIMWLGIRDHVHGYDEIDIDDKVSVRSEVARLTRLYETAVKKYKQNNPDSYNMAGGALDAITGLRARPPGGMPAPLTGPDADSSSVHPAHAPPESISEEDESPATAKSHAKVDDKAKEKGKDKAAEEKTDKTTPAAKDAGKTDAKQASPDAPSQPGSTKKPPPPPATATTEDKPATGGASAGASADQKPKINPDASPATGMAPPRREEAPEASGGTKDVLKTPT